MKNIIKLIKKNKTWIAIGIVCTGISFGWNIYTAPDYHKYLGIENVKQKKFTEEIEKIDDEAARQVYIIVSKYMNQLNEENKIAKELFNLLITKQCDYNTLININSKCVIAAYEYANDHKILFLFKNEYFENLKRAVFFHKNSI